LRILNAIAAAVIVASLSATTYLVWVGGVSPPGAFPIPEGPVVIHVKGGLLEVSTIRAPEQFEAVTKEKVLGIPVGKTVTRIRVPAVYRYHVELGTDWQVLLKENTFMVTSPPVTPSLPVAIDTEKLQAEASGTWSLPTGTSRIPALQASITATLTVKAASPSYVQLQREVARQTLKEFVARWLITQEQWTAASNYPIRVFFADEPMPQL